MFTDAGVIVSFLRSAGKLACTRKSVPGAIMIAEYGGVAEESGRSLMCGSGW